MTQFKQIISKIKQNDFFQDSFWALFGNVIAKGMTLVGSIIVARLLGKDIYGEYGTMRSTVVNIAIFSTFGLGYTATKYISEFKNERPDYLKTIIKFTINITLVISGVMALLLLIFSNAIALHILEAPHLSFSLRLIAIWVIFRALTTAQIGILSGFNAFKPMARINIYVGVLAFFSSVLLTYLWGLNGALISLLITQILNWFLNYKEVLKHIPISCTVIKDRMLMKKIINFSFPVALQEAVHAITAWLMILLLIRFSDYGEIGLYNAAMQWSIILLFIPGILRNVILTHFSRVTKDRDQQGKILRQTLLINFTATFLPFLIAYIFKDWIASFYGESFENLESILSIVLFSSVFLSLSNVYSQVYLSLNKNWLMLGLRFLRSIAILTSAYYLIEIYNMTGAKGLAISALFYQIIFLLIAALIFHKVIDKS